MDISLTITLNQATGQVHVSGPIDNKLVCYGMLAVAHDVIAQRSATPTNLVVPRLVPPTPLNGKAG